MVALGRSLLLEGIALSMPTHRYVPSTWVTLFCQHMGDKRCHEMEDEESEAFNRISAEVF